MKRLLIRPGAIGDFLVSLPALQHLRSGYTEVWTTEANAPLVRFADRVDTIIRSGLDSLTLPAATLHYLTKFDTIYSWYGANRPDFQEAVKHLPFQFFTALPSGLGTHATDYYLAQVGGSCKTNPKLPLDWRNEGHAVIHPFSGGRRKNWPLDKYRELAGRLDLPVRWTAGPEEPLDEATRFDSLWDLAGWLAGASLYIGNDSGITHLAAACGVPVVAIFQASDPAVWAPRGPHVTVVDRPNSVEEVLTASRRRHLAANPHG